MPKVVRRITFWSGTLAVIAGLYLALTGCAPADGGCLLSAEQRALPQRGSPEIAKPEDFNHIERQFVVPQVTGVHGSVSALPPPEIDDAAVAEALSCSITASAL